jgi:hypothetical protein
MERRALSTAVVAVIVVVVIGVGASAYYLGVVLPSGQTSTTEGTMSTVPSSSSSSMLTQTTMQTTAMPSSSSSSSSMTEVMTSSTSRSSTTSSSTQTTTQTSTNQTANLQIVAGHISHTLGGTNVGGTCSTTMPAQGASYVEVTNNGTAPSVINTIAYSYGAMSESQGAPSGTCVIGAGATEYIKLTGIGMDAASTGDVFNIQLIGTNGGAASLSGTLA